MATNRSGWDVRCEGPDVSHRPCDRYLCIGIEEEGERSVARAKGRVVCYGRGRTNEESEDEAAQA